MCHLKDHLGYNSVTHFCDAKSTRKDVLFHCCDKKENFLLTVWYYKTHKYGKNSNIFIPWETNRKLLNNATSTMQGTNQFWQVDREPWYSVNKHRDWVIASFIFAEHLRLAKPFGVASRVKGFVSTKIGPMLTGMLSIELPRFGRKQQSDERENEMAFSNIRFHHKTGLFIYSRDKVINK